MNALGHYIRQRAKELGLSLAEISRQAGKARATLYAVGQLDGRLPELETLIDIALVLQVHPLRLIHLVFEDYKLPIKQTREHKQRGDKSIFRADVTIPDRSEVIAGSRFTKIWEVQNIGTVAWEGRTLRCVDDELIVYSRAGELLIIAQPLKPVAAQVPVPYTPPGGIARLSVQFTAPRLPCSCLSYWKSYAADGTPCFPNSAGLWVKVQVVSMSSFE